MAQLPEALTALIGALNGLPGIGPRSAERLALHLVQADPETSRSLAAALLTARERIRTCAACGALTEKDPCAICEDARRDTSLICVVERPVDILSFEKSATYRGRYHVLGGKLSPLNGIGPDDLRIAQLEQRLEGGEVREIIMALPMDVEGDATSHYLAQRLALRGVKVTRIAHGLPAGSGIEFADELTLSRALEARHEFT